jgi:VCBS repeat-containing protein
VSGDLNATDIDANNPADTFQAVAAGAATTNGYGTYGVTAAGVWTYTLNNANAAVNALNNGQQLTDTFTVLSADGTAQLVTITIDGFTDPVNNPPVLGATTTNGLPIVELADPNALENILTHQATGTIAFTDANLGDVHSVTVAPVGGGVGFLGTFTASNPPTDPATGDGTGSVSWTFQVANSALDSLAAGTVVTQNYTVTINDGAGGQVSQVVTITINGANDTPVITGTVTGTITEDAADNSETANLLATDPDAGQNDVWQAVAAGTASLGGFGTYAVTAAGVWTYTLNNANATVNALNDGQQLIDTFNAVTVDGTTQLVTITINGVTDNQNDTFTYTFPNVAVNIDGGAGNDTLNINGAAVAANEQLDVTYNGTVLTTYEGATILNVETVNANLLGGTDTLAYTAATTAAVNVNLTANTASGFASIANIENATGGSGNDTLTGTATVNVLSGGAGNDTIVGGAGNDTLNGDAGNDTFAYTINGAAGNDGADTINGGADTDTLNILGTAVVVDTLDVVFNGTVLTTVEGSTLTSIESVTADLLGNTDNLSYAASTANVTANLATGTASGFTSIANIENLFGGGGNDTLTGNANGNVLSGNDGNDVIDGGIGSDTMTGGLGDDTYTVDNAGDQVIEAAGQGIDTVLTTLNTYSLAATTPMANMSNADNLTFIGAGNFNGTGNNLANVITGGAGTDTLNGAGGNDRIIGGGGNDTLNGGAGNGGGNDVFAFAAGFGNDTIQNFDAIATGGQELLDISALGINAGNFAANVTIAAQGANTLVTIGANSMVLVGVAVANVDQTDFILA